eukprot:334994-Amorphochlora_amoeboformis.AAC.2
MSEHGKCSCARKCNAGMSRFIIFNISDKAPIEVFGGINCNRLTVQHPPPERFPIITIAGAIGGAYNLSEFSDFDWAIPNGRGAIDYEAWQDAQARAGEGNVLTQEQLGNVSENLSLKHSGNIDLSIRAPVGTLRYSPPRTFRLCARLAIYASAVNGMNMIDAQVEQQFLLTKGYYSDFCVINGTSGVCAQPERTITYTFYGSAGLQYI